MAVSLTPRWILPLTPPVRATNVQQPSAQQGSNGHGRTVVTHTGPPVGLIGGIPKLATLVPDLSPTPCTPCAPSRWILAASTQPRAPGETRADLGVKGSQVQILSARPNSTTASPQVKPLSRRLASPWRCGTSVTLSPLSVATRIAGAVEPLFVDWSSGGSPARLIGLHHKNDAVAAWMQERDPGR